MATPMLDKLRGDRVFWIIVHDNTVELVEGCDENFSSIFTKEELIALAEEIKILANTVLE